MNKNTHHNDNNEHFNMLIPNNQEWFTTAEVGKILGKSDQFIRNALKRRVIQGHCAVSHGVTDTRKMYQVHRDSVLMFLADSANYTVDDFYQQLEKLILNRTTLDQLQNLKHEISRVLEKNHG